MNKLTNHNTNVMINIYKILMIKNKIKFDLYFIALMGPVINVFFLFLLVLHNQQHCRFHRRTNKWQNKTKYLKSASGNILWIKIFYYFRLEENIAGTSTCCSRLKRPLTILVWNTQCQASRQHSSSKKRKILR